MDLFTVISIQINERNGAVVRAIQVQENDEVMLISNKGTLVRLRVRDISVIGRNTKGVKLINIAEGEHLVGMQRIEDVEEDVVEALPEKSKSTKKKAVKKKTVKKKT